MAEANDNGLDLVRAAAERGVRQAQAMYGQMLLDGRLVERNATLALHYFERAAVAGDTMAINMVGRCLDQGWGVAASPHLAAPWFRKAAERGLDWGMYNLATLLTTGSGVPQDRHEALYWFRRASALHHAKSVNLVGSFYEDGWVVVQSTAEACAWYRRAAILGDFRGQFNYARLLAEVGDTESALSWLRRVPDTATPAFLNKMKGYLATSPHAALRAFAAGLTTDVPGGGTVC